MQVSSQKLSPVLLELAVEIDGERVKSEVDRAYDELQKRAKVRGFRPGKAPRRVLVQMFGQRVVADVAQRLVDETYPQALSDQKVQPVSSPAIEPDKLVANKPFHYRARVEIIPELEEVKYTGLVVKRPATEVTDALLDEELTRLRREHATLEPPGKPRPLAAEDIATLDFEVLSEGQAIAGAGTTDHEVELGDGTLIPEVEAALLGKEPGQTVEVPVGMPAEHPHPDLRGKTVIFKVQIKEQKVRVLPEADDEFAKDLGEYETLDQLREHLKQELEKKLTAESEQAVAEALVRELVAANPIDVPPTLVQRQVQATEQEVLSEARKRGQTGGLNAEARARIRQDSETKVRAGLLMAEIAKKESIKVGDPEIEEGLTELAEQTGKNIAKLRAEYRDKQRREMLIGMILENKVLDIIESKAKIEQSEGSK